MIILKALMGVLLRSHHGLDVLCWLSWLVGEGKLLLLGRMVLLRRILRLELLVEGVLVLGFEGSLLSCWASTVSF